MFRRRGADGLGNFEIIPENPIVAELELADARGFLFLVEESLDPVLAMLHKIEKLVEFRVVAGFEEAALGDELRRIIGQRLFQRGGVIGKIIPAFEDGAQCPRLFILGSERGPHGREGRKALAQGEHVPWRRAVEGYARGQAFQIIDPGKRFPKALAVFRVLHEPFHGVLCLADGAQFAPRVAEALLKQAAPHGGLCGINDMA